MRRILAASILAASCGLASPTFVYGDQDAVVVAAPPEITIISAGAEPKQDIRFQFKEGDQQKITMTMKMTMGQTMNGNPMGPPMAMPQISIPVTSTILAINDDGASFEMVLGAVDVAKDDSPMAGMYASAMKQLEGIKISGNVDERGQNHNITVDTGGNTNPQLAGQIDTIRNSLTQMTPPLPEQPIGAGAKWSYKISAESGGVTATNTTTVTLVRRDGDALALKMDINVAADPQPISIPGMPPTTKAELVGMNGLGTGESTVLLNRIFPMAMEGSTNVKIDLKVDMGQGPMNMGQTVDMKLSVEGTPAK